jgi:multidrug efflux pump subunit AcrB
VFRDLGMAFGVVLLLIYILIAGWFKDLRTPLVMMVSIPLSLVGIILGHWILRGFFTATSMIGFIALAGVMVRNGVLLLDFVGLARERGLPLREALLESGAVRLRPIALTAGTVIVGALVILFDPIFQGLAISLIGGSITATVLTLVVVPVVYNLMERNRASLAMEEHL